MKTLLALLFITAPAMAGQPAFAWVDAKCSVVLTTWDDEFRVPTAGGGFDPCWMSTETAAQCTSGAVHQISEGASQTIVWDGVALRRKMAGVCD